MLKSKTLRPDWAQYLTTPEDPSIPQACINECAKYGLDVSVRRIDDGPQWRADGILRVCSRDKRLGMSICHELAHYVVSQHKDAVNFGLGYGPEEMVGHWDSPILVRDSSTRFCSPNQLEEERASLLGMVIERYMGFGIKDGLDYQNWQDITWGTANRHAKRTLVWLLRKGVVDCKLKPTYRVL